jgi:carboxymethylenebutenolidase
MLIHEWWGLNEEMRALARKLAAEGFTALAVDLFDGESSGDRNRARELMTGLDASRARETLVAWAAWLRRAPPPMGPDREGALLEVDYPHFASPPAP